MTVKYMFGMADGPAQHERDRRLSLGKHEGSPFALDDPVFRILLWGHDAILEAREGWKSSLLSIR